MTPHLSHAVAPFCVNCGMAASDCRCPPPGHAFTATSRAQCADGPVSQQIRDARDKLNYAKGEKTFQRLNNAALCQLECLSADLYRLAEKIEAQELEAQARKPWWRRWRRQA